VRKYVEMDERTAFRTVSRPALFRNFHLQAGNLAATLSTRGWTSTLLSFLVCNGNPRYVQGKDFIGHWKHSMMSDRFKPSQQMGNTALLCMLVSKPDAAPKLVRICSVS